MTHFLVVKNSNTTFYIARVQHVNKSEQMDFLSNQAYFTNIFKVSQLTVFSKVANDYIMYFKILINISNCQRSQDFITKPISLA